MYSCLTVDPQTPNMSKNLIVSFHPSFLVDVTVAAWSPERLQILRSARDSKVSYMFKRNPKKNVYQLYHSSLHFDTKKNLPIPQILHKSRSSRNRPHRRKQIPPSKILQTQSIIQEISHRREHIYFKHRAFFLSSPFRLDARATFIRYSHPCSSSESI